MVLGNEHATTHDRVPGHAAIPASARDSDDHVLAVRHRASSETAGRLRADHRAVLRALAAHLMPVDDGASVQANLVVRYIDYLVANEHCGVDSPLTLADMYGQGCDLVQAHACRTYGHEVQAMSAVERDQLVWDMLENSMDGFDRFSPAYFFHTLRRHIADAMQGGAITPN